MRHKTAFPTMTNTSKGSSSWVNKCVKWMPSREKQDLKDTLEKCLLRPSSKWHLQPESYPRHFLKWTTLLLAVEKWQLHFKISLNISREKILVIKRPSKVNGCYLAPVYLNLIWWQTGSWTRLKIRCWLSAELLTHQCFMMYLNAFLYPALHNIQPQQ